MNRYPVRIALFVASMRGGGAERVMLNLANGIAARGYQIDLVLARAEGPYLDQVTESVRVIDLKASRVLASLPRLVIYLRREKPVALLSAMNYVNIVALWALRLANVTTRIVISEHSMSTHKTNLSPTWRSRLIPLLSYFYRWADAIITVSTAVQNEIIQATRVSREYTKVIYNPVVNANLQRKAKNPLAHFWFEPGNSPVILAVGRLEKVKNFSILIQAFSKVRQSHSARLLILGEGKERPKLQSLVKQLGIEQDVSMPGFVQNPYAYMSRSALFVQSSQSEALPTVLIEALYCGVPIIATACSGGTREILKDGEYGRLVPVGDVSALAQAIEEELNFPSPSPPPESWRPFEIHTVVDQYLHVLLNDYA